MSSGKDTSHESFEAHVRCITCLARNIVEANNPNGSKMRAMNDNMPRFV